MDRRLGFNSRELQCCGGSQSGGGRRSHRGGSLGTRRARNLEKPGRPVGELVRPERRAQLRAECIPVARRGPRRRRSSGRDRHGRPGRASLEEAAGEIADRGSFRQDGTRVWSAGPLPLRSGVPGLAEVNWTEARVVEAHAPDLVVCYNVGIVSRLRGCRAQTAELSGTCRSRRTRLPSLLRGTLTCVFDDLDGDGGIDAVIVLPSFSTAATWGLISRWSSFRLAMASNCGRRRLGTDGLIPARSVLATWTATSGPMLFPWRHSRRERDT